MQENRFQHDFIMWFGQTWPEYRNLLFMVHNEAKSKKEASYLKSMGLISGASDLALIQPNHGHFCGLELKASGSIHSVDHIQNQINWGRKVIENNGFYLMSSDMGLLKEFITGLVNYEVLFVLKIQTTELLKIERQFDKKTIKF